jgi:hypothetical protein
MNMEQVELLIFHDANHFTGKCKLVRRILKQWIGMKVHFMIEEIFVQEIQTRWL